MSAAVKQGLRAWLAAAAALCCLLSLVDTVRAAETVPVMEQYVTQDALYLYLQYTGEVQDVQAQIGTEAASGVTLTPKELVPVSTWLLLDNSVSIQEADRAKAKELLTNLVAGRSPNETFTLCTYNEHLNVLLQDSQSYAELKSQIDTITHVDQESYLTDVLAELLAVENSREEPAYVRVIVICDGVDNNPAGLTREELDDQLSAKNIPIYTLGCETGDNDPLLKELYSLSRQTGAQSWSLTGLSNTLDVVTAMGGTELPLCAAISIPENLRDGSTKGVRLTFSDGSAAETQAAMPFGAVTVQPEPEPELDAALGSEPEPEPEASAAPGLTAYLPWIGGGTVVVVVLAVLAAVLLRQKKERDRIKPVAENSVPAGGATDILPDSYYNSGSSGTLPLINGAPCAMLSLSDLDHPEHHFEVPLRTSVSIGRSTSNQIVLDYERSVSGTHCEIFSSGTGWKIRDLNSGNGTYLNGARVTSEAEITDGSVLKLGRLNLLLEIR